MSVLAAFLSTKEGLTILATILSVLAAIFWHWWSDKRANEEAETKRLEEHAKKKIDGIKSDSAEAARITESARKQLAAEGGFKFEEEKWGKPNGPVQ